MPVAPLEMLRVRGLASIEETQLDLNSPVTVLVGPNGAGKSNLIAALEMLGRIRDHTLQPFILTHGGMSSLLYRARDPARSAKAIYLAAWADLNGYSVEITATGSDEALLKERVWMDPADGSGQPHDEFLGSGYESRLGEARERQDVAEHVSGLMSGWRVFHFHDTSFDAPPKQLVDTADNLTLRHDGGNLAALLLRLQAQDAKRYDRIVRTIRLVAPFFQDFVLKPDGDSVRLRWRQRDIDGVFSANTLSDGTLRYICLATLLLQDQVPRTIVLDEPELGLHPFAMHQFVELLRSVTGQQRNAILATQSVALLNHFSVDEVAVVERTSNGTIVTRPSPESLDAWLDDFSLGELWEKNLIRGRPRLDDVSDG